MGIPAQWGARVVNAGEALGSIRDYRLVDRLGQGGMGTVYRAVHARLGKVVAVKVLPADMMQPDAVARFQREMRAVGKLHHPNIVQAFDAGEHEGTHFLAMECVEGCDLATLVQGRGPLSVADACEIVRQAALGLQHAHQHGLVHRDIKPSNLMLSRDGHIKLLDLGLALIQGPTDHGGDLTVACQIMGTPDYLAPEQASDSHSVDIRADIYSLGCTLYYLLAGTAPYLAPEFRTTMQKISAHLTRPLPDVRLKRNEVSEELKRILERMVAKEPGERFATPGEVATALTPLAVGSDLLRLVPPASTAALSSDATTLHSLDQRAQEDTTRPTVTEPNLNLRSRRPQAATGASGGKKWLLIGASALLGLIALAVATIRIPTKEGTLVLTVDGPNAVVTIDGETAKVKLDSTGKTYRVAVEPGTHSLVVTTPDGLKYKTDDKFKVEVGKETLLTAHLERPVEKAEKTVDLPVTKSVNQIGGSRGFAVDMSPTEAFPRPRVQLPDGLKADQSLTVEMRVTPATVAGTRENRLVWNLKESVQLKQYGSGWEWLILDTPGTFTSVAKKNSAIAGEQRYLAGVCTGKETRLYVDGQLAGSSVHKPVRSVSYERHHLGRAANDAADWSTFDGTIDEVRISTVARYNENYTPIERLEADKDTFALYHCDEGSGDVLVDSSGNNRHGKIVGARWKEVGNAATARAVQPTKPWTTREIAEWTIRQGGVVSPTAETSAMSIEELPETFKIYKLRFDRLKSIGDEEAKLIGRWKQVPSLSLQLTSITDIGLRHLASMKLSALDLYGTKITGEGFDAFADREMGTIVVTDCKLTEVGWQHLAAIGKTEQWFLDGTTLTDAALVEIASRHPEIQLLGARSPKIGDVSAEALTKLPKLKSLNIAGTAFTDVGLAKLAAAQNLQSLQLSLENFSPEAIAEFKKALPKCQMVSSGAIPRSRAATPAKTTDD